MREVPTGYGFADALTQKLKQETYKPSANREQWYYVVTASVTSTMYAPKPAK